MGGVIHAGLKCAVHMGEDGGTAAELHALAEIVATFCAEIATAAHNTCFDSNSLSNREISDAGTDSGNNAGRFMSKN